MALFEEFTGTANAGDNFSGTDWIAQSFQDVAKQSITSVALTLYRAGAGENITVSIRAASGTTPNTVPTGADLAVSAAVDCSAITTAGAGEWVTFTFTSAYELDKDTEYVIVARGDGDSTDKVYWNGRSSTSLYANGNSAVDSGGTGSWSAQTTVDRFFRAYGDRITASTDKIYSKKLVAIGNQEVWYESSAGTMAELTAANDDMDSTDLLTMVEAFQKVFIANKTNLKVIDFANTKIATTDLNTHAPDKGNVLTGGTSAAAMVVDYITSVTADAACTIYGYRTTTATFASGETVTGTDDDGNAITFVLSAAETAPPHWYDWTVYGNDTTNFGDMPSSAYMVARYRGRLVLSGHPNYPHQWYMSKVSDPWNWTYGSTDPLTAVAGNNVDAGEIGDIVRALIPYGDDFLIFGCATSVHIMDGDPAFGGSIDELSEITGIYSPWSWCKDEDGNLYFWGSNGLYKMAGGRSKPVNISQGHLPKWVVDWAVAPATHRIVLTYDPSRNGIIISKTTLADGTNLNYWYDLKTEGFYPETYPTACGIFCSFYYDSDASGTRELILGSNDGYLRSFYDADKDDDSGGSDTAISSYVTLPLIKLSEAEDSEGKLTSLTFELAGGASSGDFSDMDGVTYELHVGDDAETLLEDIRDGATARESGTLSGTGRKNRIRKRVRGRWLGIKLYNSTATETWVINLITGEVKPAGKIKN